MWIGILGNRNVTCTVPLQVFFFVLFPKECEIARIYNAYVVLGIVSYLEMIRYASSESSYKRV